MARTRNGHGTSPNAVIALDTTWNGAAGGLPIALGRVADDSLSSPIPPSCQLDTVDLDIDTVAGGATTIQCMLTHDAAGLHTIAGPSGVATLWAGTDVPANRGTSLSLGGRGFTPLGSTVVGAGFRADPPAGVVYLWLRLDAGTANLSALGARLNWRDPTSG